MAFIDLHNSALSYLLSFFIAAVLYYLISSYYSLGLNRYPGPLLAKFTKLWHLLDVWSNKHHDHLLSLHRKYGDVVRIGPRTLSIARPDYVNRLYGISSGFKKSSMYDPFNQRVNGKRMVTTLSQRDEKAHAAMKKPVAGAYSLTVLAHYEPLIDEMTSLFLKKLDESSISSKAFVCDIGMWTRLYAMDVILYLTFGSAFGFLEQGADINNFFGLLDQNLDANSLYVTMPWTSLIFKFNPVVAFFSTDSTIFPKWCMEQIQKRQSEYADPSYVRRNDFLDKFIDAAQIKEAPGIDYPALLDWCFVNVGAGADTTTIALRSIIYHLLKSPAKKTRLIKELEGAKLSHPVRWAEAYKLPYLDSCVKEGLRLHPAIGLGMEREVSGLEMPDGYVLPPDTLVSMNAWVVGRQDIYGDDPDLFRPERWLQGENESEQAYTNRLNEWKRADLVFSAGSHSCTGKYVAFMEIYKLIPTLFLKYDIRLEDEEKDWEVINRWTTRQTGVVCSMKAKEHVK